MKLRYQKAAAHCPLIFGSTPTIDPAPSRILATHIMDYYSKTDSASNGPTVSYGHLSNQPMLTKLNPLPPLSQLTQNVLTKDVDVAKELDIARQMRTTQSTSLMPQRVTHIHPLSDTRKECMRQERSLAHLQRNGLATLKTSPTLTTNAPPKN